MKLILLSTSEFFVEEDTIINALFEEGLDLFHLRKPNTEPVYSERLLTLLPEQWHSHIVVHEHFYLKEEFGLRGIHLNASHPDIPAGFKGQVSRSCHSLDTLQAERAGMDYVFLSPVFHSISHPEREAAFTASELHTASRAGLIDKKVMAAGGINSTTLTQLQDYGFGGAVILGDLWNRFNIHSGLDYKEVIAHFRKLRKAAG
ncbi:MAG: thiamine phosphate synthase [Bacteroidaceae bacterium]|nr:thiamine phosphate synthase [Bacteroidaceae bacterium]